MIDSISASSSTGANQTVDAMSKQMGKDQFLQLLVAQLRNQDPLEPMANSDFVAQMTQFTSVEQLINMNKNLSDSLNLDYATSQSIANSMATSLIGKTVTADSDMVNLDGSGKAEVNYNLVGPASEVKVSIYNEDGVLVDTFYDEDSTSGMNSVTWDGNTLNGPKAPMGNYKVSIEAMASDGTAVKAKPFLTGKVSKIQYLDGAAYLMINGSMVMLGDVIEVES